MSYDTKRYDIHLEIQTTSSDKLSISAIGNIPNSLSLHQVYFPPHLATILLSVGQLVENNCFVSFTPTGCLVQDQEMGIVRGMGPKCGKLFPIRISLQPMEESLLTLYCNSDFNKCRLWHRGLGHPQASKLLFMF